MLASMARSSISAGHASCGTPAASSMARRDALPEASTRRGMISGIRLTSPSIPGKSLSAGLRSFSRLMMAAAVSSIERRVTSITGQPLSANIRRAYCTSLVTRRDVDIGGVRGLVQRQQAIAPHLDQPLGRGGQPYHQRRAQAVQLPSAAGFRPRSGHWRP